MSMCAPLQARTRLNNLKCPQAVNIRRAFIFSRLTRPGHRHAAPPGASSCLIQIRSPAGSQALKQADQFPAQSTAKGGGHGFVLNHAFGLSR